MSPCNHYIHFNVNGGNKMENQTTRNIGVEVSLPVTAQDVKPLNYEAAISHLSDSERQEVLNLADEIDVRKIEIVIACRSFFR